MSDWFFCSAWYEKSQQEVHFEIANEDGDQYFFGLRAMDIHDRVLQPEMDALDKCHYAEEDMLAMAVALIDDDHCSEAETYMVKSETFRRYFIH